MNWLLLLEKLLPLYGLIVLGYIGGKYLQIAPQPIAKLLIYLIVPVVFFGYVARLTPSPTLIFLPLLVWGISAAVLGIIWLIARRAFPDARANLSAATAAGCNSGYFGIPIFMMLFGEQHLGVYILAVLGYTFNELTLVYFTLARGHYSWRDSLRKLLGLPSIYAGMLGIAFTFSGWHLPDIAIQMIDQFRGAYVVLGMMMLGLGLSQMPRWVCEWRYLDLSFLGRFGISTLCIMLLIWLAAQTGGWLTVPMQQSLWLLCVLPLAANIVAYATELKLHPDQAAAAVLLSTLLTGIILPLAAPLLVMIGN